MLAVLLIILGICSRLIPHAPNFTPVVAVALFAGVYLSRRQAVLVPLVLLVVSDWIIGLHAMVAFTWGAVVLVALLGQRTARQASGTRLLAHGFLAAVIFFVVTNFGVWLVYYPKTWEGFLRCYVLAVPFFRYTIVSTLLYGCVLFGSYEWLAARVRTTAWAKFLLIS